MTFESEDELSKLLCSLGRTWEDIYLSPNYIVGFLCNLRLQWYCFSYLLQTSINYSSLFWFNIASPCVPQRGQAQRDFTLSQFHLCNTRISLPHVPARWFKCFFSSLIKSIEIKSLRWLVFSTQCVSSWKYMLWPQSSKALGQISRAKPSGSLCIRLLLCLT